MIYSIHFCYREFYIRKVAMNIGKKKGVSILKAEVDKDTCVGCARCVRTCPDLFTLDEKIKAVVVFEKVPRQMEECAKAAELLCPVSAIKVSE